MSEITCDQVLREVELYLDGELDSALAAEVTAHLFECRACFDRADFQRKINRIVRIKSHSETPAHLWARVILALDVEARRSVSAD